MGGAAPLEMRIRTDDEDHPIPGKGASLLGSEETAHAWPSPTSVALSTARERIRPLRCTGAPKVPMSPTGERAQPPGWA
ncbi:hypothetical protein AFE02nite_19710 [Actinotalea fermentans]|uniref:Uncharacterized protein n=1 Tax=Actinotalea fermentans TaxID=43671 RepID=A0A511YYF2_9CELL|nr:hypothetical protein AFE02nite_19710 [Actinotalea fermentans]